MILPAEFVCPLTKELMSEPMVTRYGIRYEKNAILAWLLDQGNTVCPMSGHPLRVSDLLSDKNFEWKIQYWAKKNGYHNGTSGSNAQEDADTAPCSSARRSSNATPPPDERFICPITKDVMKEPMMSRHGHNFEKYVILSKIQSNGFVCPISGKTLRPSDLVSNRKLQTEIQKWRQSNQQQEQQQQQQQQQLSCTYEELKETTTTTKKKETKIMDCTLLAKGKLAEGDEHDNAKTIVRLFMKDNHRAELDEQASRGSDPNVLSCIDEIIGTIIEYDPYEQ